MFSKFIATQFNTQAKSSTEPHLFVPEVVQTSAMDCGPAALKCLLEGFNIPASYGRLREACQTDVDGTSINTLEDVAQQLGLQAEQMVAPVDHLLLSSAHLLPALVVTVLPNGFNHFVVVWRVHGPIVQLMDPATGRRWSTHKRFLSEVYRHTIPFAASTWRAWAATTGFIEPLRQRLDELNPVESTTTRLIEAAVAEPSWRGLASLDAATRMVNSIVQARGVERGQEAIRLVEQFAHQAQQVTPDAQAIIPEPFWSVHVLPSRHSDASTDSTMSEELLLLRGAVLLNISGARQPVPSEWASAETAAKITAETNDTHSSILTAVLNETNHSPEWEIVHRLREDGLLTPALIACAVLLAAAGVTLEAALLRGLMVLVADIGLGTARLTLLGGLIIFVTLVLLLEFPIAQSVLRMGRRLETRIRIAFLEKIPRLGDRYFHSRLISDMAQRAYGLNQIQHLPDLAVQFLRLSCQLLLTTAGIIWLYPASAPITLLALIGSVGSALLMQSIQSERDMRVRTHNGALSRFYLDALMGLMPIRTHSAQRTIRREHEMLLTAWARENLALSNIQTLTQSLVSLVGIIFAIWIVTSYVMGQGEASSVLLLLYWTLNLPALSRSLANSAQQYPTVRNNLRRILEPLGAPEDDEGMTGGQDDKMTGGQDDKMNSSSSPHPITVSFEDVTVYAGGHVILKDINLTFQPGEHVAIVGPSGAGKSSLVGLILGWHRPASGRVLVNGVSLIGEQLQMLRRLTVWVDPSTQLWNRSLQENLRYGNDLAEDVPIGHALEEADLYDVLERLPNGLQTQLGEGGGLVSGGEGQRVRLGRALLRSDVRLAILDEPFRGLDRAKRRQLLANARQQWNDATLLCITHDIADIQNFTRIIVIEEGCIVEEGTPQALMAQPTSRYRHLLEADENVQRQRWGGSTWRRLWLAQGVLQEVAHKLTQPSTENQDELRQVKGIGPVFAKRLHQAGIHTLADLAGSTAEQIRCA